MKDAYAKLRQYLKEVWIEVKPNGGKVSWPSRQEVISSTIVVLVVVVIVGVFLGAVDAVFAFGLEAFTKIIAPHQGLQ